MRFDLPFPPPINAPQFREGTAWKAKDMNLWIANGGWLQMIVGARIGRTVKDEEHTYMADLHEKLEEASDSVEAAYARFSKARDTFRGNIKNEIASIDAAATKIVAQFSKVQESLMRLRTVMDSAEMKDAIHNAERLSSALANIDKLSASRVTFSVAPSGGRDETAER